MTYSLPVIKIQPVYAYNTDTIIGTQYVDDVLEMKDTDFQIDYFMVKVDESISKFNSIILYRQDVRAFADTLNGKEAFKQIKTLLRSKYTVLKLKYNPRSQEFCGLKTAFIIHQK